MPEQVVEVPPEEIPDLHPLRRAEAARERAELIQAEAEQLGDE